MQACIYSDLNECSLLGEKKVGADGEERCKLSLVWNIQILPSPYLRAGPASVVPSDRSTAAALQGDVLRGGYHQGSQNEGLLCVWQSVAKVSREWFAKLQAGNQRYRYWVQILTGFWIIFFGIYFQCISLSFRSFMHPKRNLFLSELHLAYA